MSKNTEINLRSDAGSSSLQTIISEIEATLHRIYGDRFLGLVLFGSHARGTAVQDSDIDLVLLLQF